MGDQQCVPFQEFVTLASQMGAGKLHDVEVKISNEPGHQTVNLLFSHADFPGMRFGYRTKVPGEDKYEEVWLAEELATGALHRLVRDGHLARDFAEITWLYLSGQVLQLGGAPISVP